MEESNREALDRAFEVLKTYKRGDDPTTVTPIEEAIWGMGNDAPAVRKALEKRLAASLGGQSSEAARHFICYQLAIIGSADSVAVLAGLLSDESASHMARYALERIPGPEAEKALREALKTAKGSAKVGVINSIGVRRDVRSVSQLSALLSGSADIAGAAAKALGEIGTVEAAKALGAFRDKAPSEVRLVVADACLSCAEQLIRSGQKSQAVSMLEALNTSSQAAHVRLAASRALSAAKHS